MKRLFAWLGLCAALTPRAALAADCSKVAYEPVPGSPGRMAGEQALTGFARLYGATGAAEREVLPALRAASDDESAEVLHLRFTSIFGASRELMVAKQHHVGCPRLIRSDYDLHAGTFGIGLRHGPLSAYYVTSTVMGVQAGPIERTLGPPAALDHHWLLRVRRAFHRPLGL